MLCADTLTWLQLFSSSLLFKRLLLDGSLELLILIGQSWHSAVKYGSDTIAFLDVK